MAVEVHIWNARKFAKLAGLFKKTGHAALKVTHNGEEAYLSYWPGTGLGASDWIRGKVIRAILLDETGTLTYEGGEIPTIIAIKENALDEGKMFDVIGQLARNKEYGSPKKDDQIAPRIYYNLKTHSCSSAVAKMLALDGGGENICKFHKSSFDRITPYDVLVYAKKLRAKLRDGAKKKPPTAGVKLIGLK